MRTRFAGKTDVGLQRDHNEDNLLLLPRYGVIAVADGMGGHRSGDVASQLAVSTLADFFNVTVRRDATWPFPANPELTDEENYLLTGLRLANRRIFDRSLRTMADFGMGTTIVAAMFGPKRQTVAIAHVGDSRCYRVRAGRIEQLTRDHSLVSDAAHMAPWMSEEEVAQLPPNVITRALGIREDVLVDLLGETVEQDDVYLLCSDGLSGLLTDEQMLRVVTDATSLDAACAELIDRANANGGPDNITVTLARVHEGEPAPGDDDYVEDDDEAPPPRSASDAPRKNEGGSSGRTIVEVRLAEDQENLDKSLGGALQPEDIGESNADAPAVASLIDGDDSDGDDAGDESDESDEEPADD